MKKWKGAILLGIVFFASCVVAFHFEASYRRMIRRLYEILSSGKISFHPPGKYLHFASGAFLISFSLFVVVFLFLLYRKRNRQRIVHVILAVALWVLGIVLSAYVGSMFQLVECTACQDGTRILFYHDIDYDTIFIGSLLLSIVPAVVSEIKKK